MDAISSQSLTIHHHKQLPSLGSIILFKRNYGSFLLFIIILNKFKKV